MKYSIIVPVFNRPDEVDELLESLTRQTLKNFEVVIVEDGSKIPCKDVCDKYANILDLHYYAKPNSGPGQSRNYGAERANGEWLIVLDSDLNILEINNKGRELLGIDDPNAKGRPASDFFSPIEFYNAYTQKKHISCEQTHIPATGKYIDMSINYLDGQNVIFGILKDVTDTVDYENRIMKVKMETLTTTDEVIKKQMRVAQEIASLLGETTAETKVALLKLKKTLTEENKKN